MAYQTVIFDFDSTLIQCESLEVILAPLIANDLQKLEKVELLTQQGMSGELSFKDSLTKRLEIAKPTQKSIQYFVQKHCPNILTRGVKPLIDLLHQQGVDVFIISGGFKGAISPFANYLKIAEQKVFGVEIEWGKKGEFIGLNENNGFAYSKIKGAQAIRHLLGCQSVIVGDGYTDYMLYQSGIVTDFIAYTEHAQRKSVLEKAQKTAATMEELKNLLV